jgi:hypothetical protein
MAVSTIWGEDGTATIVCNVGDHDETEQTMNVSARIFPIQTRRWIVACHYEKFNAVALEVIEEVNMSVIVAVEKCPGRDLALKDCKRVASCETKSAIVRGKRKFIEIMDSLRRINRHSISDGPGCGGSRTEWTHDDLPILERKSAESAIVVLSRRMFGQHDHVGIRRDGCDGLKKRINIRLGKWRISSCVQQARPMNGIEWHWSLREEQAHWRAEGRTVRRRNGNRLNGQLVRGDALCVVHSGAVVRWWLCDAPLGVPMPPAKPAKLSPWVLISYVLTDAGARQSLVDGLFRRVGLNQQAMSVASMNSPEPRSTINYL